MNDLREDLKKKKPIFGADRTLKEIRSGKVEKIYISKNCRDDIKRDILHYSKLADVKVIELKETNNELGAVCKKPFNISVIAF